MEKRSIYGTGYCISLPSTWLYGDHNIEEDAPILKKTGLTAKAFSMVLDMDGTCFYSLSDDFSTSLQLAITETDQKDFTGRSDSEVLEIANAYVSSFTDAYTAESISIYDTRYRYAKVVLYRSEDNSKHFHFFTVKDGRIFSFIMECHSSEPNGFEKKMEIIISTLESEH